MELLLIIASILVLTVLAGIVRKVLKLPVCPICAGVSSTWIGLLALRLWNIEIDPVIVATLMGGSVVGLSYLFDKHLQSERAGMLWKALSIPAGFAAVYGFVQRQYGTAVVAGAVIMLLVVIFSISASSKSTSQRQRLMKEMENCCS